MQIFLPRTVSDYTVSFMNESSYVIPVSKIKTLSVKDNVSSRKKDRGVLHTLNRYERDSALKAKSLQNVDELDESLSAFFIRTLRTRALPLQTTLFYRLDRKELIKYTFATVGEWRINILRVKLFNGFFQIISELYHRSG